ncbi:MAG TPA: prepilin peptidase [Verrucomicrobiae bacterium]|jgi:leader peptidase (prepilin peptidase)/N-methyltransferase|nr:prepilin peptidase [Verrucomicrobiae bacterium]
MGINPIFDSHTWAQVPFGFWSVVFFTLGCIVGSFLNVCIHRMPLGLSIVSPPSHCPHCKYSIPWYLNIPLVTWISLRGKCKNCGAPIVPRYFLVELLTGISFLSCWMAFGHESAWVALAASVFIAGLIVASFIDFEHFIIPDEITIGGTVVGFVISIFLPALHHLDTTVPSIEDSLLGIGVGLGLVYGILRLGKLVFGKQNLSFPPNTKILFSETSLHLPDEEVPYGDLFYRKSDVIVLQADHVELVDRCYKNVLVRLSQTKLLIGEDEFSPDAVPHMEATSAEIMLPREAMGLGDVKFMAAIGAFLGWEAVVFSLMVSSIIGAVVGVALIASGKREWSSRLPYGPYIALAAVIWIFWGWDWRDWLVAHAAR